MREVTPRFKEPQKAKRSTEISFTTGAKKAKERSGGRCEARTEVCTGKAEHVHHIKFRSRGGTHDPSNLLHVCLMCHQFCHSSPQAEALGLAKSRYAE